MPTAAIRIIKQDGAVVDEAAVGNGSVDAVYQAIAKATGVNVELDDYSIHSVTHGTDAQGEVHVVIRQGEHTASGRGVSTDIVEASAKAYLEAINRLVNHQEREREGNIVIQ
ncbi:2-isopropylmalate synthase [compost metagenome]